MFKKVEHIGIAVKDLTKSNELFSKLFGKDHYKIEKVESEKVSTSFFMLGETKIEFITKNFGLSPEMMLYLYDMKKMLSQKGVKAVMPYYLEIQ